MILQPGYVLAFISSAAISPVSFDRLAFTYYRGSELEEDHYYPFGLNLEMAGIDPTLANNVKYNSKELQYNEFTDALGNKSGLTLEDYGARMQDPKIGWWNGVDEKAESYEDLSPYVYGANNPVKYVDKDGKGIKDIVVGYAIGIATNIVPGSGGWRDTYTPDNPDQYNNALSKTYNASMAIGAASIAAGPAITATGQSTEEAAVTLTFATGGASIEYTTPAAAGGATMTAIGVRA